MVWTFPSPYPWGRRRVPSGLYTFPAYRGLARDCRRRDADGFPDFDTFSSTGFPAATPRRSQLLYRLSYGPTREALTHDGTAPQPPLAFGRRSAKVDRQIGDQA